MLFCIFSGEMGAMVHGVGLGAQEKEHQEVTLEVIGGDQWCEADGAGSEHDCWMMLGTIRWNS